MGRARSRRRRGKTGGVGSSRSKSKSNKSKSTGGSRGRSRHTRGGQHKANRNQNQKAKRTVKSVKTAVSKVAKRIGKSLRGTAVNAADNKTKPKSKLQQQLSNLKQDIAQKSTKEARFKRREDRLRNQFGLDYSRMNPSFKVDASIDQAAQKLGIRNHPLYQKYVPQDVKNWKFKYQMMAPTKLGVSDGWRRPNRGGQTVAAATRQQLAGLRADPSQDIGMMYENILGRKADQGGLDYWTNEFRSGRQSLDDIRKQFVRSDEFQGRSDADKSSALDGLKQRRNQSNRHLRGLPMLGTIGSLIGRGKTPARRRRPGRTWGGRRGGPIGSGTPGRGRPGDMKDIVAGGLLRPGKGPRRGGPIGSGTPGRRRPKATDEGYRGQRPPDRGIGRGRPKPHGDPGPTRPPRLRKKPKRKLSTSEAAIRRFESRRMRPVGKRRGVGKPTGRKNTGARRVRKLVGRR